MNEYSTLVLNLDTTPFESALTEVQTQLDRFSAMTDGSGGSGDVFCLCVPMNPDEFANTIASAVTAGLSDTLIPELDGLVAVLERIVGTLDYICGDTAVLVDKEPVEIESVTVV